MVGSRPDVAHPTLYALTSSLPDWAGHGPAMVQWVIDQRAAGSPAHRLADVIVDHNDLPVEEEADVSRAVAQLLSSQEALLLSRYLQPFYEVRVTPVALPLLAAEALALRAPTPITNAQTLWRLQPSEHANTGLPFSFQGIVSLWPWPGLHVEDVLALTSVRQRLGLDPVPPFTLPPVPVPNQPQDAGPLCEWPLRSAR